MVDTIQGDALQFRQLLSVPEQKTRIMASLLNHRTSTRDILIQTLPSPEELDSQNMNFANFVGF